MVIKKVLNNNVVIIENELGIDEVVCGKGLAFSKTTGDVIDESKINQIFVLKNEQYNKRFQEIVSNIPIEYIDLSDKAIEIIKLRLGQKISDSIFVTLSDHLCTAIDRAKEGIFMPNTMLWEIKNYYPTEFEIGQKILSLIKEETGIELKDDEAGFIALHIVNSETEDSCLEDTMEITKIVQEINKIVRYHFGKDFNSESVYYYRFITHVKFFAQRLVYKKTYVNGEDKSLLEIIKDKYHNSYLCVEKIAGMILKNYDYEISDEEKLYLTIHIHRIVHIDNN